MTGTQIHYGNNNIKIRKTSCDRVYKEDHPKNYSCNPREVNCIPCIQAILRNQTYKSKRTDIWLDRIAEIRKFYPELAE